MKLGELYEDIEREKVREEDAKWLGLGKFVKQIQGLGGGAAASGGKAPGASGGTGLVEGEVSKGRQASPPPEVLEGNRSERRMALKLKPKRKSKIDNANA